MNPCSHFGEKYRPTPCPCDNNCLCKGDGGSCESPNGKIAVLDHGYVKFIQHWGSDEAIIEAARMSTSGGFNGWGPKHTSKCATQFGSGASCDCLLKLHDGCASGSCQHAGDEKLLRYLYEHKHMTPFEMAGMVIEVQAPIFVFREWHRHRTQSYNEMSARYAPLPDVNYVPTVERLMLGGGHLTKQAGTVAGAAPLTEHRAKLFRENLLIHYARSQTLYEEALSDGVPKELARVHLPVGRYSRMRASTNLRNWLGFLTLRMAPEAQWEIRQYANAVGALLSPIFPRTWGLFAGELRPMPDGNFHVLTR